MALRLGLVPALHVAQRPVFYKAPTPAFNLLNSYQTLECVARLHYLGLPRFQKIRRGVPFFRPLCITEQGLGDQVNVRFHQEG